jgi:hypothetical protein
MKNIHILSTEQPSRLRYNLSNVLVFTNESYRDYGKEVNQNIYITSDEEIKEGDWILIIDDFQTYVHEHKGDNLPTTYCKKIILTNEQRLIEDGVQALDDEFLEWFIKNPTCEYAHIGFIAHSGIREYKIIIPQEPKQEKKPHSFCETPEEKCTLNYCDDNGCQNRKRHLVEPHEQETLEEAAERHYINCIPSDRHSFISGAKWQQEIHLDIKDNKIELLEEDLECIRMYLDDLKIPRTDKDGNEYSIVGRIKWQSERMYRDLDILKNDLYTKLPTGNADTFELLKIIKNHLLKLDDLCGNK